MARARGRFGWLLFIAVAILGVVSVSARAFLLPLHSFNGVGGTQPYARLVQGTDGNFYGTTSAGGAFDSGTVFTITPAGTLTTLHSFSGFSGDDGRAPITGLIEGSDGMFYGTTASGGSSPDAGTVFKISPGGTLTTLHRFSGGDGDHPVGELVLGMDGQFYGNCIRWRRKRGDGVPDHFSRQSHHYL